MRKFFILFTVLFFFPLIVNAQSLNAKLAGKFLLQVQDKGRIWYVSPVDYKRYEITPFNVEYVLANQAVNISSTDLLKILIEAQSMSSESDSDHDGYNDNLEAKNNYNPFGQEKLRQDKNYSHKVRGKIFFHEDTGSYWYVDFKGNRWQLTESNVFNVFKQVVLGISNANLEKINRGLYTYREQFMSEKGDQEKGMKMTFTTTYGVTANCYFNGCFARYFNQCKQGESATYDYGAAVVNFTIIGPAAGGGCNVQISYHKHLLPNAPLKVSTVCMLDNTVNYIDEAFDKLSRTNFASCSDSALKDFLLEHNAYVQSND